MRLILVTALSLFYAGVFSQTSNKRLSAILGQSNIIWKKHQTEHFHFFVEGNLYPDQHIDSIKSDFESKRKDIISFLGNEQFVDTANIIIVDTKEKILGLLGFEAQGFAIPESSITVFLNSKNYFLATKHELTHYYAYHIWGKPVDNWFSEGLAVFYDNKWNGYQIDTLAKHLKDNNKLFRLSALEKKFHSLNPMIAYPQIGSFTSFLLSTYGKEKLKELWRQGFKEIKTVYGKSLKKLEDEWLKKLDSIPNVNIYFSRNLK